MTEQRRLDFAAYVPDFYAAVKDFPDFSLAGPLSDAEIANLEKDIEFQLPKGMREFLGIASGISLNGLSMGKDEFASILMPNSEALITGYFYLRNPGDRLLLLPGDEAVYYMEQRNGSITKMANNMKDFLNAVLPRHLYG